MTTTQPVETERCTNSSFRAITGGDYHRTILSGLGVLEALQTSGYGYTQVETEAKTVAAFVKSAPAGAWYLFTAGHALAYVDGELTDTERRGADRRRLLGVYRVTAR